MDAKAGQEIQTRPVLTHRCALCDRRIVYDGKHWIHEGTTPRHPARPIQTREEDDDALSESTDHQTPDPDFQVE